MKIGSDSNSALKIIWKKKKGPGSSSGLYGLLKIQTMYKINYMVPRTRDCVCVFNLL